MARLKMYFTDGTRVDYGIERLDRDEVDLFLDDLAATGGATLVTDEGPISIPAGGHGVMMARVVVSGDEWLEDRTHPEEDDLDD